MLEKTVNHEFNYITWTNFACKVGKSLKIKENGKRKKKEKFRKEKKPNMMPLFGHIAQALHF